MELLAAEKELEELELQQKGVDAAEEEEKYKQQSFEMVVQSCDCNEEMDHQVTKEVMNRGITTIGNNGGIRAPEGIESTLVERKEGRCMSGEASNSQLKEECNTQEETVGGVYIV